MCTVITLVNPVQDLPCSANTGWPSGHGLRAVLVAVQVFRVASVCLGSPPDTICWEYRDKDKNFHRMGPLTPQEFYREHVKPLYNIQDKVCLTKDIGLSASSSLPVKPSCC